MTEFALRAWPRAATGKGFAGRLRRAGRVPGVLYGPGRQPAPIELEGKALSLLIRDLHGSGQLISLAVADGDPGLGPVQPARAVLIKEVQHEPLTGDLVHIDFHEVPLDQAVVARVPLVFTGEEDRPSDSGVITHVLREVEVKCLPGLIPPRIEVDVTRLGVGESISVGELEIPEGVKLLTAGEEVAVAALAPAAPEAEAEKGDESRGDAAAPNVPEVVGERVKHDEKAGG